MATDALEWLHSLPPALSSQQTALWRLLAAVECDPRWRFLALSCSIARGTGDADSDLDVALGVRDDAWPQALAAIPALVAAVGEVVAALHHQLAEWGDYPHQRTFVQYVDGVQLDMVAYPASGNRGRPPDTVALYDPDGRLAVPWTPAVFQADARSVHEWAFLGWTALADLAKYLRRGSLWEALARLDQARTQVWRLWAVGADLSYPAFGLTSVLDSPAAGVPPRIEATVAGLDYEGLRRAALTCAALLDQLARPAPAPGDAEGGSLVALALFVRRRLDALPMAADGRIREGEGGYR